MPSAIWLALLLVGVYIPVTLTLGLALCPTWVRCNVRSNTMAVGTWLRGSVYFLRYIWVSVLHHVNNASNRGHFSSLAPSRRDCGANPSSTWYQQQSLRPTELQPTSSCCVTWVTNSPQILKLLHSIISEGADCYDTIPASISFPWAKCFLCHVFQDGTVTSPIFLADKIVLESISKFPKATERGGNQI